MYAYIEGVYPHTEGGLSPIAICLSVCVSVRRNLSCIELELIQSHMAQKPVLRGEVGCARVA